MTTNQLANKTQGVSYSLIAYFCFALGDCSMKWLGAQLFVLEVIAMFATSTVIMSLLFTRIQLGSFRSIGTAKPGVHLIRALLMLFATVIVTSALPMIPLPLFYALAFTLPFWACLWGSLLFSEKLSRAAIFALCTGFLGVCIAIRPDFTQINPYCLGIVAAMASFSLGSILSRWVPSTESAVGLIFYPRLLNLIIFSPFVYSYLTAGHPALVHVVVVLGSACSMMGGTLLSRAFQRSKAKWIAPCQYSQILYAVPLSYVFWNELPDFPVALGALLIIGSGWFIIREKETGTSQKTPTKGRLRKSVA